MPTKFNTTGDRGLEATIPVNAPMDESFQAQGQASYTGASLGSALSALGSGDGSEALGTYSVEAADIIGSTAGYKREKERILQGLSSAQDKATVERYLQDLSRLRNGEIQGALSPQAAATRINSLTKSYINSNPSLALKFRTIHNGLMEDVQNVSGSTGKEIDPDMEAVNNINKTAVERGWTPTQVINYNRMEAVGKVQVEEFAAKARLGLSTQADFSRIMLTASGAKYQEIAANMSAAAKNPNFQGVSWFAELSTAKGQIEQLLNLSMAQAQVDGKFTFDATYQKDLVNQVIAPFNDLLEIAKTVDNPKTRQTASDALRRITENGDFVRMREQYGYLASFMSGKDDLIAFAKDSHEVADNMRKGLLPNLEAQAKYDPYLQAIVDNLKRNGFDGIVAQAATDVDRETPRKSSGVPTLDRLNLQGGLNYVLRPTMSTEGKQKGLVYLAGDPNAFEAWDKRPDVVNVTKSFGVDNNPIVNALKQNSVRLLTEQAHQADPQSLARIQFNALDPKTPFQITPNINLAASGRPGYLQGADTVNPHAYDLVTSLNQQYRVFSNFLPRAQAQKWAADSLDQYKLVSSGEMDKIVTNTPSQAVKPSQEVIDAGNTLKAEAEQAGMTLDDYVKWINTPAQ